MGSKGIKNKNLCEIGGITLVEHTIRAAKTAASQIHGSRIVVSTDGQEIIDIALKNKVDAPFVRPSYLCGDDVESLPVVQHAVNFMELASNTQYEIICYMQPTSPLVRWQDIMKCYKKLLEKKSLSAVTVTTVSTHPFKMKRMLSDGKLINYIDQGFDDMRPRQKLPPVFRRAGSVYMSRRKVVMEDNTLISDDCMGVVVPPHTAIDIDKKEDLELARICYDNYKN
ncbi:N-acylneuraminate cytidylyltransferase [Synechococcus sp. M16.1]|nr:N-acylneuraminate cytidylyltransferase [Synechococcus sp. M16.1]